MKATTLLKLRLTGRWLSKEIKNVYDDFALITNEEKDTWLIRFAYVILGMVIAASCGMAYSLAKSFGWLG
jgi:hypothetical protein